MDITKFFDQKRENLTASQQITKIQKNHAKKASFSKHTTSPKNIFEKSLKSGDCIKIFVNFMKNIEKQVKEFSLPAQENKEKHINGESSLRELTKSIDLISDKFDEQEKER